MTFKKDKWGNFHYYVDNKHIEVVCEVDRPYVSTPANNFYTPGYI